MIRYFQVGAADRIRSRSDRRDLGGGQVGGGGREEQRGGEARLGEEARENLRRLARILMRIEDRLAQEWYEQRIRDSGEGEVESEQRTSPPL